jgi:hypothetical protein
VLTGLVWLRIGAGKALVNAAMSLQVPSGFKTSGLSSSSQLHTVNWLVSQLLTYKNVLDS